MQNITFQSIFETPTKMQSRLNSKAMTPDGRIWEYLKTTEIVSQYMVVSNPGNLNVDTVSSTASQSDSAKYVYLTEGSAGWTVGAYQDHWVVVDSGTGVGQGGKIKDNTADTLELYFEYAFTTVLAVADSDIVIRHEPDAEKVATSTLNTPLKGVAQVAFAASDYGWFLCRGIGLVMQGETDAAINELLTPGDDTEGYTIGVGNGETPDDISSVGRVLVACDTADKAALTDVNIW